MSEKSLKNSFHIYMPCTKPFFMKDGINTTQLLKLHHFDDFQKHFHVEIWKDIFRFHCFKKMLEKIKRKFIIKCKLIRDLKFKSVYHQEPFFELDKQVRILFEKSVFVKVITLGWKIYNWNLLLQTLMNFFEHYIVWNEFMSESFCTYAHY